MHTSPLVRWLKETLFPYQCLTCGRYGTILCRGCYSKKVTLSRPYAHTTTFVSYKDPAIREIIRTAKYHSSPEVLDIFAESFSEYIYDVYSEFILTHKKTDILLIPVPISQKRKRERGYNQSYILAEFITNFLKKTYSIHSFVKDDLVIRIKDIQLAHLHSKNDRLESIQGAFKVAHTSQKNEALVFIIDDVVTTGATTSELMKVLSKAGMHKVEILAAAH